MGDPFGPDGSFRAWIDELNLNDHFGTLGSLFTGVVIVSWLVAAVIID